MIDLIEFSAYIGRKTKYGERPHAEAWGYTGQLLSTYVSPVDLSEVVRLFGGVDVHDEVQAAEWLVLNDEFLGGKEY